MGSSVHWCAIAAASLCFAAAAPTPVDHVLVLDLKARGVDKTLTGNLSEVLLASIRDAAPGIRIVGQSEVQAMLVAEQQKLFLGCGDDTSCLAEIGGAIGADHLLTGNIGKVGRLYLLNLKLIDTRHAEVVGHTSRRLSGAEEGLVDAISEMAAELIRDAAARVAPAAATSPRLTPSPERTTPAASMPAATPDAQPVATADRETQPVPDLPPDSITSEPPTAVVSEAVPVAVEETPWYASWWFWTITGVVVAGATATTIAVVATSGPATTSGSLVVELTP